MLGSIAKAVLPRSAVYALQQWRRDRAGRLEGHEAYVEAVAGRIGLEVGGPSELFRGYLPLYRAAERIDGVNFGEETIWEGRVVDGADFSYIDNLKGTQFVCDATDLGTIPKESYDFVISSNCLEHVANPLRAIHEWTRVVKPGGSVILVLPNQKFNFDRRRPITRFDHLVSDYENGIGEDDLTHLDEILGLHDLSLDALAGSPEQFRQRSRRNHENRALHHHVFDQPLMRSTLEFAGLFVVALHSDDINHFALARR